MKTKIEFRFCVCARAYDVCESCETVTINKCLAGKCTHMKGNIYSKKVNAKINKFTPTKKITADRMK